MREPELKVRVPAAEVSLAVHLLQPLLPILTPLCPVCMSPLEICGSVLWAEYVLPMRTHTHHTHVCLFV